ncbi:MAG: SpoIIIAH-like family protein [Clostridioides sp.]|jgi:stage III sporulation protein AH|nr:SpoIIIAH-like family protein [Clostridioides sp.]
MKRRKFNCFRRSFVVSTLTVLLVAVGVVNYKLSKQSLLETSAEFKSYEQAQYKDDQGAIASVDKDSKDEKSTAKAEKDGETAKTTAKTTTESTAKTESKSTAKTTEKAATKTTDASTAKTTDKSTAKSTEKNTDAEEIQVVDSKDSKINEKVTETSKAIEKQIASEKNIKKETYILDMKMTREKQRNELVQTLNEMINNPSTTEESRKDASNMKLQLVKNQESELKIENLLSTKGYEQALVYISDGKVNVVINQTTIEKKDAAKIFDLVSEQANVKYQNIKLTNNKK